MARRVQSHVVLDGEAERPRSGERRHRPWIIQGHPPRAFQAGSCSGQCVPRAGNLGGLDALDFGAFDGG
jgi:hypothetical protein